MTATISTAGRVLSAPLSAGAAPREWTFEEAAAALLDRFDHNDDGAISDERFFGLRIFSETRAATAALGVSRSALLEAAAAASDAVKVRRSAIWGLDRLMRRADTDGDRIASRSEIEAVVRSYDANGDGRLSASEFRRLQSEVGAEFLRTWTSL